MDYICKVCEKEFQDKPSAKRKYCSFICTHKSSEWRKNLSEAKIGTVCYWRGKKRSEETKQKISQSLKNHIPWNKGIHTKYYGGGFKKGHPGYWLGKKRDKKTIEKISFSKNGKILSKEHKEKIGKKSKAMWADQNFKKKMIDKMWRNPEFMKKLLKQQRRKPSNPEKAFNKLIPENVRYVGDWSWWRRLPNGKNKNPDFKVNNQNKVIEIFGGRNYFHTEKQEKELIELYKQVGLECLIVWEEEIYKEPNLVKNKVNQFIEA